MSRIPKIEQVEIPFLSTLCVTRCKSLQFHKKGRMQKSMGASASQSAGPAFMA